MSVSGRFERPKPERLTRLRQMVEELGGAFASRAAW
jgi:hypothetical protein